MAVNTQTNILNIFQVAALMYRQYYCDISKMAQVS